MINQLPISQNNDIINLFFIVYDYSGTRTYTKELLNELSMRKGILIHKIYLECSDYERYTEIEENNIITIYIPKVKRAENTFTKYSNRCLDLMDQHLRNKRNIIFHLNNSSHLLLAQVARKRFELKLVYTVHYLRSFFSIFAENKIKLRNIRLTDDISDKQIFSDADQIICVTHFAAEVIKIHYKIPSKKLSVIYNGYGHSNNNLNYDKIAYKENLKMRYGFSCDSKIILYVGRLIADKGVEKLVKVFNKICTERPNIKLVLIGDGDYKSFIELATENIGNIFLLGNLPRNKVMQFYHLADIGVIPSVFEQCSYVALEMMAHGLPIVTTNIPGLNELFQHQSNALLSKLKKAESGLLKLELDEESLYVQLNLLLENSDLGRLLGQNAYEKWRNNYTSSLMGLKSLSLYKKLIDNH